MQKRPDESHVEFARRCVDAGQSEHRVSFEMNLSAGVVASLASVLPDGMSIQDMMRAAVASTISSGRTRSLIAGDSVDLPDALDHLAESVQELATTIHAGDE